MKLKLIINEILKNNKDKVMDYKAGKTKLTWFFCWSSNEIK